jgi:hypothetical protein
MYPGGTVVLASIYFYGSSASKVALIKKTKKKIIGDGSGKISLVASVTLHHILSILTTFKQ